MTTITQYHKFTSMNKDSNNQQDLSNKIIWNKSNQSNSENYDDPYLLEIIQTL